MFKKIFIYNTDSLKVQFIRYGFVATVAFIIDFGLLFLFTQYLHIFYLFSATFSFLISLIANYLLSVKWIFPQRSVYSRTIEIILFVVIAMVGLGINDIVLWFITEKLQIFYLLSKIIASVGVFFWNFFARRYLFYKVPKLPL